jgi:hypothetical protein
VASDLCRAALGSTTLQGDNTTWPSEEPAFNSKPHQQAVHAGGQQHSVPHYALHTDAKGQFQELQDGKQSLYLQYRCNALVVVDACSQLGLLMII